MSKENAFIFCGIVDATPDFQFTEQGKCKGRIKVKRHETWDTGSRDVELSFSLWGKPAEDAMALNLAIGMAVRMRGSFGSWEAKNKAGELLGFHNVDLKCIGVDVRSEQPQAEKKDDFDF